MRNLFLITGSMRAGKTSLCKALFNQLQQKSARPAGIVEENQRDERGVPLVIELLDLGSGERVALASRKASAGDGYAPFDFRRESFAWAMDRIKAAIAAGCGPVMLDEIGALETQQGGGFLPAATWALGHGDRPLILTIRPELVESLLERLSPMNEIESVQYFHAGDVDAETLVSAIVDDVFPLPGEKRDSIVRIRLNNEK